MRKEIWPGWQYAKEHQDEFNERKEEILKAVDEQLKSFRIFVAQVPDKRIRERFEAAIMHNIYYSKEHWSELADIGMFLKERYNAELPIEVKNICGYKMYGLPEMLEIKKNELPTTAHKQYGFQRYAKVCNLVQHYVYPVRETPSIPYWLYHHHYYLLSKPLLSAARIGARTEKGAGWK